MKILDYYHIAVFYLFGSLIIFTGLSFALGYEYMPVELHDYSLEVRIASFAVFMSMLAHKYGLSDAERIKEGLGINHVTGFLIRATWCLMALFLLKLTVLLAFPGAFWFSLQFNYHLNEARGKNWWYISGSNTYDKVFLALFPVKNDESIKRAGIIKNVVEVVLLTTGVVILKIWIL